MGPLAPPRLTTLLICALSFFTVTAGALPASAAVLISVNKSTQQMSVAVDGVPRYRFTVSTGRAGYGTPNGSYHPQRLAASWFSKLYYNSPMPHSIFFHGGYAIHGSYEINRLGGLWSPEAILSSRAVPGHRHGDMEDGRGQLTRIATGVSTDKLQTTTGVRSPGCFRSSIPTDAHHGASHRGGGARPSWGVIDYGAGQRALPSLRGLSKR
jgi:hypothetical protein